MRKCFPSLNNPKNLDPSYMTDLDFLDCFRRKNPFYNTRNTVCPELTHAVK